MSDDDGDAGGTQYCGIDLGGMSYDEENE